MKPSQLEQFFRAAFKHGRRVLVEGPPGCGKSFIAASAARLEGMEFIPLCAPLMSPVKVGGYPVQPSEPGGDAKHALFDGVARAMRASVPTVLCWEDLAMAGGETLKSILEFVQFGRINGRTLPECVVQCATTNNVGHGADVYGLMEPLKTRWHTIVGIEPDLQDTITYGMAKGWPSWYLAWLRNTPDALWDWKPSKNVTIDGATPRGHEYAAEWFNLGVDDKEVIAGCIGKGRATQALAFRDLQADLPDVDSLFLDPDGAPVPDNPSARFLVAMAVATRLSSSNFNQGIKYLARLPQMFRAFSVCDALKAENQRRNDKKIEKGYKPISSGDGFTAWVTSPDGREIVSAAN